MNEPNEILEAIINYRSPKDKEKEANKMTTTQNLNTAAQSEPVFTPSRVPVNKDNIAAIVRDTPFVMGYVVAALVLSDDNDEFSTDGGVEGFNPESLLSIYLQCKSFAETNENLLRAAYEHYQLSGDGTTVECHAGNDLWLVQSGSGCGYADRGLGDVGQQLTDSARLHSSIYVVMGDDGQMYFEGGGSCESWTISPTPSA